LAVVVKEESGNEIDNAADVESDWIPPLLGAIGLILLISTIAAASYKVSK
jgi:hypothetical protein